MIKSENNMSVSLKPLIIIFGLIFFMLLQCVIYKLLLH